MEKPFHCLEAIETSDLALQYLNFRRSHINTNILNSVIYFAVYREQQLVIPRSIVSLKADLIFVRC